MKFNINIPSDANEIIHTLQNHGHSAYVIGSFPCLPIIQAKFWNEIKDEIKETDYNPKYEITTFKQMWESTALEFGGFGGQAVTEAYTTVIEEVSGWVGVFFDGKFAYKIKNPNRKFYKDLANGNMVSIDESWIYK